jgi:hypothetical protein
VSGRKRPRRSRRPLAEAPRRAYVWPIHHAAAQHSLNRHGSSPKTSP